MKNEFFTIENCGSALNEDHQLWTDADEYESLYKRIELAADPKTEPATLKELASFNDERIKEALLENPRLPNEILFDLALDENPDIRYIIASNPYINGGLLRKLSEDENPYVASRAHETMDRIKLEVRLMRGYRDCLVYIKKHSLKSAS